MEYVYAALLLHESDVEINEDNLSAVLDAAGVDVEESRVKALVAALEDVDIEEALQQAAAVPAGGAPSEEAPVGDEPDEADETMPEAADDEGDEEAEPADAEADDDEEEEVSGEGLGDLFG